MFNKKGDHVDWAISMGIFLIYLVGLFILLRPGVTPVYKPEGLLQILENKFEEKVMWEVREIPLIVELCKGESIGEEIKLNIIRVEDEAENFAFSKIKDSNGEDIPEIKCGVAVDGKPPIISNNKIYYFTYHQIEPNKKISNLNSECDPYDDDKHCIISLGASITKEGVNMDWLNELKPDAGKEKEIYDQLKKDWDFPEDKEFSIYYGETEKDLKKLIGANEPQGVNFFIKQFKTQKVSSSGEITIPLIVNIRVW